jgi:hypothetical protein
MTGKTYRLFLYGIEEPKEYIEKWEAVAIMNATPPQKSSGCFI